MPEFSLDSLSRGNNINFELYDLEKDKFTPVSHIIIPKLKVFHQ